MISHVRHETFVTNKHFSTIRYVLYDNMGSDDEMEYIDDNICNNSGMNVIITYMSVCDSDVICLYIYIYIYI